MSAFYLLVQLAKHHQASDQGGNLSLSNFRVRIFSEMCISTQGPVYELKWSPFLSDVFLSCSADWTVKLWHQDSPSPVYTFTSLTVSSYILLVFILVQF